MKSKIKRSIALSVLALTLIACGNECNHHECDVDTFASHCDENGNLVRCEDETTGEPCVLSEGCDTYVTTTVCTTSCLTLSASSAACADAEPEDGGSRPRVDAGRVDAGDDSGELDASDDATDSEVDASDD
ncbi:MAG: hypothetical protein ACRELY_26500 [Polyangiaceae bacterium]